VRKILFLFSFISSFSFSQKSKSHKFVPYFSSLKVEKLAKKLTSNLESDSEKVIAIHSWITHTIKFDVKKWLSFNYTPISARKTLTRRKTIDYSLLFHELCTYSNIQSTIVSGYTKNKYIDITEKFYSDEQTWNAVYVNNQWKLIDACFDAGEIVYYKRTFAGYFIFALTLGTSDRLVYKPHFNHSPQKNYLLKSGVDFKYDHIPANPIWQLTDPIESIEQLEQDSAFYYRKREFYNPQNYSNELDGVRSKLIALLGQEKEIIDGFASFQFNSRNNYGVAKSYYIKASSLLPEVILASTDNTKLIEKCDSIKEWTSKAVQFCDSTTVQLLRQKEESIANNKAKRAITLTSNKLLISSSENVTKSLLTGMKIGIVSKISNKTVQQKNKNQTKDIVRDNNFSKTAYGRKTNLIDSTASLIRINSLADSIAQAKQKINSKLTLIENLYSTFDTNIQIHRQKSKANKEKTVYINALRIQFFDDLDYILKCEKDSIINRKFEDDSLLFTVNNGPIVSYMYSEFLSLKTTFAEYHRFHAAMVAEYTKFKKALKSKSNIDKNYEDFLDSYKKAMNAYNDQLKDFKRKFKNIYKESKNHLEIIKEERHQYVKESFIESQMYSTRSSFINRHYKVRASENKTLKKSIEKTGKKAEELRKKILLSKT